jgi:predicted HicB family RNase H-like nuclease
VREQTTLRTVRIPQELDDALETISKERGLSVNSFVSMLLKKYVQWDKYAERFGYIL